MCNQKGGVGKTTTAITLASLLAMRGNRTLLVDLDPQGNSTSGIGIDKRTLERSVYHAIMEPSTTLGACQSTQIENLFLLPSNIELTGAEVELVNEIAREAKLGRALSTIAERFEFAIIDCPPSLGLLTINALASAHSVIIPIQCEFYAMEGLGQLISTLERIRINLNEELCIEGILMTMADNRTNLADQVIKEVRSHFGEKVYNTVIPRSIKLGEAPGFGKPIVLYDKHCVGCKKYEELVEEFSINNVTHVKTIGKEDRDGEECSGQRPVIVDPGERGVEGEGSDYCSRED